MLRGSCMLQGSQSRHSPREGFSVSAQAQGLGVGRRECPAQPSWSHDAPQSLFRRYPKLAGMTGTASTEAKEFLDMYKLSVAVIPPHRPTAVAVLPQAVLPTAAEKWVAVVEAVVRCHAVGRPVLVGTRSVECSEHVAGLLAARDIPCMVCGFIWDVGVVDGTKGGCRGGCEGKGFGQGCAVCIRESQLLLMQEQRMWRRVTHVALPARASHRACPFPGLPGLECQARACSPGGRDCGTGREEGRRDCGHQHGWPGHRHCFGRQCRHEAVGVCVWGVWGVWGGGRAGVHARKVMERA